MSSTSSISATRSRWWWPDIAFILALVTHGVIVVIRSEQQVLTGGLVVLAGMGLVAWMVSWPDRETSWGVGDIVAMAATVRLMMVDGGLAGWFSFWPLVVFFWLAVVRPSFHLGWAGILAGAGYAAATFLASPVGATEVIRLTELGGAGLLVWAAYTQVRGREQRVHHLQTFLSDALDSSPVGLLVLEPRAGKIDYANRTASEWAESPLTGSTVAEAEARMTVAGIMQGAVDLKAFLAVAADGEGSTAGVFNFVMPSGAIRHLRLVAAPHHGRQGETASIVVWAEDVTTQIRMGEERRRFLQAAGHHLRTPLTPVMGWAELLVNGALDLEEASEAAREILEGARSLERLFDRMLSVTQLPYNPGLADIEVGELLERHLRPLDSALYCQIETDGDPTIPIRCHPPAIAGTLYELLDNSRRFGKPPLRLTWEPAQTAVEMRVTDSGPGPVLPAGRMQALLPWSPMGSSDEMPKDMGTRLGLAHAGTLATLGGSQLDFIRTPGDWHFALRLPGRSASGNKAASV